MEDASLEHLLRTAVEDGVNAFWKEALNWLVQACQARGARITPDLDAPQRFVTGLLDAASVRAIVAWEEDLRRLQDWVPDHGSLTTAGPPFATVVTTDPPMVHIPIHQAKQSVGALSLCYAQPLQVNSPQVVAATALTNSFARLAALAIDRHRLQRRLTRSGLLYELSRTLSSSLDIDTVLEFSTALAANALGAETSALLLLAAEWKAFVVAVAHGAAAPLYTLKQIPHDNGAAGWVAQSRLPLIINDPASDPAFSPWLDEATGYQTRNLLCAPMLARGKVLGVLLVCNTEDGQDFTVDDMEWLATLAAQASITIENARLYSSLREERDRIIRAEEELRRRLARNLHDSAAQLMGSLLMNIEVARRTSQEHPERMAAEWDILRGLVQEANKAIRQSLLELRPLLLESRGLAGALKGLVNQQRRLGFAVQATIEDLPDIPNKQIETAIYLIAQEALSNALKHAAADHTWLRMFTEEASLVIEVEDDGKGLDPETALSAEEFPSSLGLLSMRERVDWLGGHLLILSPRPGHDNGSILRARLPLARVVAETPSDGLP